ncbi:hypothetical protein DVH24_004800 [Malus domestica]|uniref:UMP kinase n=1 Tax=Malus domestica TaxID=3750 RepID=A0A498IBP7_MALDO|nr:hypothetical protein DVH24_004800 [Malus domestica]
MEQIVGNSVGAKATSDNDKGVSSLDNTPRQSKSFGYGTTVSSPVGKMNNKVKSAPSIKWRRVVFKISSAALAGTAPNNVDSMRGLVIGQLAMLFAKEVVLACRNGVEVAIVGRNFFCGDAWVMVTGLDRIIEVLHTRLVNAEAALKGTNADGVYDCNSQDNNFTFDHISMRELVTRGATSMDMMALTFCEENRIPVVVL